jgi:diadenosine tetraphosphate (Ap4A) HIT family hydrolase
VALSGGEVSCFSCEQNAAAASAPPRDAIVVTELWRVCHSFNSSLPGWLVVIPMRHVEAIASLSADEAAELGPLLRNVSAALQAVTGCEKTYVIQFAEAKDFSHVHFHVVPRMSSFTEDERGPKVFTFLGRPEEEWVPAEEMDRIALDVRRELEDVS